MPGKHVRLSSSDGFADGYLSLPPSGNGPGVVVLQEWWGLVPHIESVADRLAEAGYAAFAPDLYHGERTTAPDRAAKLMMGLNIDATERELRAAVAGLLDLPETKGFSKVGTVGFCMGGLLSLYAACRNSRIGACVVFYGGLPNVKPDIPNLHAPMLGLYAERDGFVTVDSVRELENELTAAEKDYSIHVYPDADHAFFNDTRPEVYREADARDAWQRVLAFYHVHLKGETA